ncbi:hypothetical protein QQS21_008434 [Conoideocrella luteorostrata]|uniref:Uncharacterized protein n=1 Tax=Conoideocrella luteorostrata TaxID=1105319 RepID=A0AAJ0CLM4_9HYPO|nr:hypothetical protein QQS21_008434 [Conoideocrella luteorostrata]
MSNISRTTKGIEEAAGPSRPFNHHTRGNLHRSSSETALDDLKATTQRSSCFSSPVTGGAIGLARLQETDEFYRTTPAFDDAACYCVNFLQDTVEKSWRNVRRAFDESNHQQDRKTTKLSWKLVQELESRDKFILQRQDVDRLERPSKYIHHKLGQAYNEKLGPDEMAKYSSKPAEWVNYHCRDKVDGWARRIPESRAPFGKSKIGPKGYRYRQYATWPFTVVSRSIFIVSAVTLFCIPVVIETSGFVTQAGALLSYATAVVIASLLFTYLFGDLRIAMASSLAYAALLANVLKK